MKQTYTTPIPMKISTDVFGNLKTIIHTKYVLAKFHKYSRIINIERRLFFFSFFAHSFISMPVKTFNFFKKYISKFKMLKFQCTKSFVTNLEEKEISSIEILNFNANEQDLNNFKCI